MKGDLLMRMALGPDPARHLQDVLRTVDCIYAAACGEAPWDHTLAEVCRIGRLDGCALSAFDQLERRRLVLASYGLGPAADPMLAPALAGPPSERILRSAPGTVWQDRQSVFDGPARPSCEASMRSGGLVSWAAVIVGQVQRQVVLLEAYAGVERPSGGPKLDDFLRQLAPHLTRAWRLGGASRSMAGVPSAAASRPRCHGETAPAPDLVGLPDVDRLRAEFGLTKAEARLALRLAEGSSLASAAQAFDVKLTTIRSQLQQVFAKTGTSRQTELVAMLLCRGHASRGPLWSPVRVERQSGALVEPGS
jgi:DNA-binding CsgD family transcriptional regulator